MSKLYTFGLMGMNPDFDYITSEVTGYEKEKLIDFNPNTFWRGNNNVTVWNLDFDFNEAVRVDALYFFINNYKTVFTSGNCALRYDSTGDTVADTQAGTTPIADITTPHRIITSNTTTAYRYWTMQFNTFTVGEAPDVSIGAFCRLRETSHSHQRPTESIDNFLNTSFTGFNGNSVVHSKVKMNQRILKRNFSFSGSSDLDDLRNAFLDCRGTLYPLALQEGTAQNEIVLCRFNEDTFNPNEVDTEYYEPSVSFKELTYIDDGETI